MADQAWGDFAVTRRRLKRWWAHLDNDTRGRILSETDVTMPRWVADELGAIGLPVAPVRDVTAPPLERRETFVTPSLLRLFLTEQRGQR